VPPTKRVLCVDDHDDTRFVLKSLLGFEGFQTEFATNAAEAIEVARSGNFDLYLLDSRLPDISGVDLCRELRKQYPDTPIVIYSGDAYPKQHSDAMQAGATAYVDKPNIDELIATVSDYLTG
jgi:CheY-like chemotaxis protein